MTSVPEFHSRWPRVLLSQPKIDFMAVKLEMSREHTIFNNHGTAVYSIDECRTAICQQIHDV